MVDSLVVSLSADEFLHAFLTASLPFDQWNHTAHLRMAYLVIIKNVPDYTKAYQQIKVGIQHFNSFHAEKLTVGYHETITRFWFEMIAHAIEQDRKENFDNFLTNNPQLLQTNLLFDKDLLFKEPKSRVEWVPPDCQPMPFKLHE